MDNINAYSHLTLEERRIILKGIINGSTKAAIAQTIGKEIKAHRFLVKKCPLPLECSAYRKCAFGRQCTPDCPDYTPFRCSRRDRSPGACNGCPNRSRCRFDKYEYNPEKAQSVYRETLVDSRVGVNLTSKEAKAMADVIGPPSARASPLTGSSMRTLSSGSVKRPSTTTLSLACFTKWPA